MAYSYETVMISSQPYASYGDIASAQLYLQASMSSAAVAWLAADTPTKSRSIVSAVRWMDAQNWVGTPTDLVTPQSLQWPRKDILDQYGTAVDEDTIPVQIAAAEFELAAWLILNPDIRDELQNPTPASLTAGSVSIRYFRPLGTVFGAKDVQTTTPFPQNVMDLIGLWLEGNAGNAVTASVQACGYQSESPLTDYPGVNRGF